MKHLYITLCLIIITALNVIGSERYNHVIKGEGNGTPSITITSQENGLLINLELESFTTEAINRDGNSLNKLLLNGGLFEIEKGKPDMQYLSASISIPVSGSVIAEIETADYTEYTNISVAPSSGDPGVFGFDNSDFTQDAVIYSSDAFYPGNLCKLNDPYLFAGIRGQVIFFYPFQYNPVSGVLRVYSKITIKITHTNTPGINELIQTSPVQSGVIESVAKSHFSIYNTPASRELSTYNSERMLIISHASFINELKPFIDWKIQKGIECEVVDVATIGNASQIKQYVSNYYFSKGLTYLLLVGDAAFVPSINTPKGLSDNSYGYISGDDHYPEIFVGRFSCETTEQCKIMVGRSVDYEKNPALSSNYSKITGIASGLGPGDDNEYDYEHVRKIMAELSPEIYKEYSELYDGSRGERDENGNPTAKMVSEKINEGQGALIYIGHGSVNSWVTSNFSTTDAKQLANTEIHPLIWTAGCDNGNFEGTTCLAEGFQRASKDGKPSGAVGTFMSSSKQSWYPPMEAQDEISKILSQSSRFEHAITFGALSLSGCIKMNDKYGEGAFSVTDTWILFGDPSLEIRTAKPMSFNPLHATITGADGGIFNLNNLPKGATITFSAAGKIISSAKAESEITALILTGIEKYNQLTLTITHHNYKPYISEIQITDKPAIAINPTPGPNTYKVPVSPQFSWELADGCNPESFIFSIREKGTEAWSIYPVTIASDLNTLKLKYLTAYEWKVTSINTKGTADSKIFRFTTIARPNEDFEQEGFPRNNWVNSQEWYVDNSEAFEGNYSLHSGNTYSRGVSSLFYECNTLTCDYISFEVKVNAPVEGSVLSFYVDNVLVREWSESADWSNFTYTVGEGHHTFEWKFANSGDSIYNTSAAWLDNIYLPINNPFTISATEQSLCSTGIIQLEASISNYASILWTSRGTGTFDDPTRADAIYFASEEDLLQNEVVLDLQVNSNNNCDLSTIDYKVKFFASPTLPDIEDATLYMNEDYNFPAELRNSLSYKAFIGNTPINSSIIKYDDLNPGQNTITLVAENNLGCSAYKQFTITKIETERQTKQSIAVYPNPSTHYVTLTSDSWIGKIQVSIYSYEGTLIEKHEIESINNITIQTHHLSSGLYIVRTENNGVVNTSRFIKI